jgi:carnitine 3-dehydrogenase
MRDIKRGGLVGGGVIGAGWAARMLLNGIDVAIYDPDPEIGRKLDAVIGNARRAFAKLMPSLQIDEGSLTIADSVEAAVAGADFIQESLPEREDLKCRVLSEIDRAARPDAIIASSTSGLLPTRLQADMARPERFVVGHPFNPVYLLPLVEICGGAATSEATKDRAADFYGRIGMHPLKLGREIDGFVADRLLEALWREALWLVEEGVATTAEIDDAIRYGAGLRWSFMGTFLIYRLAGGEEGMRHFLAQFGPALKLPWTKLVAPELTEDLVDRIAAQSDAQADGVPIRTLERLRDDCLVSVLAALRGQDYAAGAVVKRHEALLQDRRQARAATIPHDPAQPLRLHRARVEADWVDYNGHMTESRYLQVFGDASDALFRHVGLDSAALAAGRSYYTVETHIRNLAEAAIDAPLHVTTQVIALDPKRLHVFHSLYRSADEALLATAEQLFLHVDTKAGHAVPADPAILDRLQSILSAQSPLPAPPGLGRFVGAPR